MPSDLRVCRWRPLPAGPGRAQLLILSYERAGCSLTSRLPDSADQNRGFVEGKWRVLESSDAERPPPLPLRMFTSAHLLGMTLAVQNPDELIAVIPHLLGFKPEESLVFLPMRSDLPVARVDLPTTARDRDFVWNSIRDAFSRYAQPGTSVGIVCITADRAMAEEIGPEFAARLDAAALTTTIVRVRVGVVTLFTAGDDTTVMPSFEHPLAL